MVADVGLHQELVAPILEVLERLSYRDVVHEDAAVGATIERVAEALEALLARCVPDLQTRTRTRTPSGVGRRRLSACRHASSHAGTVCIPAA